MGYSSGVSTLHPTSAATAAPLAATPSGVAAPVPLDKAELIRRAQINSPELVAELQSVVVRQVAEEASREQRIDTKATALLSAVGLSVALVSMLAGPTLVKALERAPDWLSLSAKFALAIAAGLAIGTGVIAVLVLRVRAYGSPHEEAVWNASELRAADADPKDDDDVKLGVTIYRRYMLVAMWEAHQKTQRVNTDRARLLYWGQIAFIAFCCAMVILGGLLVAGIAAS